MDQPPGDRTPRLRGAEAQRGGGPGAHRGESRCDSEGLENGWGAKPEFWAPKNIVFWLQKTCFWPPKTCFLAKNVVFWPQKLGFLAQKLCFFSTKTLFFKPKNLVLGRQKQHVFLAQWKCVSGGKIPFCFILFCVTLC